MAAEWEDIKERARTRGMEGGARRQDPRRGCERCEKKGGEYAGSRGARRIGEGLGFRGREEEEEEEDRAGRKMKRGL